MADGMDGVLQLASLIGMEGLSYWILLWGMLPFVLWRARDHGRAGLVIPLLLLLLLPASWVWGRWRLAALHDGEVAGVTLLLVQPNVAQGDKWNGEKARMIFERLMTLSTEGEAAHGASHIIWPESAVPFLLDESADGLREVAGMLRPDKRLVTGAIRREGRDGGERYFTSILEVDPQGLVEARYDKWRLVPGGEFLPFAWLLEPLGFRKVVSVPESFSAGRGPGSFDLGAAGRAGLLICYEAIFPDRLVETEHRPDWIINVTNDAWFGRSVGPYQHLAQVRMRAVEHNLPIARAANSGISAIMDGGGRYIARSLLDTEAAISGPLPRAGAQTVFASRGRMPAALAALAAALLLVFAVARRERG
jgi:apolipoprotein N-acyltransferase